MIKTIILFFLSIFILVVNAQTENNQLPRKTIITGQVSNLENIPEHNLIKFIYNDILAGQVQKYGIINNNGQFNVELYLAYPIEFYLQYSALLTFYISPGDSIHFDINGDSLRDTTQTLADEYKFYNLTGTSEKMNADITRYTAHLLDSVIVGETQNKIIQTSAPLEYKEYLGERTKKRLSILEDFNAKNKTCEQFQNWAKLDIKFGKWDDLMRYRWLNKTYKQKNGNGSLASIPEEYFNFIDNWDDENKEYLKSKRYLHFLHEYSMFYDEDLPWSAINRIDRNAPDALTQNFRIRKAFILKHKSDFIQEVLLAKMYYQFLDKKYYLNVKEVYSPTDFSDVVIADKIQKKMELEKQKYENPKFAEGSVLNEQKNENDFLKSLISKYPNKVLYIDFWATWCSPCLKEMSKSQYLNRQLEREDIVFIYLANRCEDMAWKATIADKRIKGEHYLLTDKQYAELSQIFGITGIPHYALIDRKGDIVRESAPKPSSGEELMNLLNELLN